uniref:SCAN box domain-containing protein n=1 Tax=Crocodylus porosus TaxID=8502 RepID=A0A7M4F1R7_CROPO
MAGQLGVLLIGRAQGTYRARPQSEAVNYDKVKKEIMYHLNINPERYRQAFRMKKQSEDKSPWILLQVLADLFDKWLRPQEVSKVDLCDQILLEQFLMDLDHGTQWWVRCHCPKSSAGALRLAEDYDSAQGEGDQELGIKGRLTTISSEMEHKEPWELR